MKRILVVEDDGLARTFARVLLAAEGYEVHTAADGLAGLRMFREARFDLVVLDLILPGMDGLETLLAMDPAGSGVPVIAISAGGAGPLDLARSLGAARCLPKPHAFTALAGVVGELLGDAALLN